MGQRWTAADQWEIELITLNNRAVFRIRHYKATVVYALTVEEMAKVLARYGVSVADLVEVDE